ncbi:MAG TPA: hypothetical protein VNR86_05315 [Sphingomicrobium sp.]|nr:hypothetical protein [Sphingomicrobium sp.]
MPNQKSDKQRQFVGRVSIDTKGPPGIFMERTGLWDGEHLTR